MAFQKVGNGKLSFVKYKDCEEGQVLAEGTYLGTKDGTYGIQHQIKDENGDVTVLNSSGHLNFLLENHVTKGDYIRVIYSGKEVLSKGKFKGKESHQFEVLVDSERSTDGANVSTVDIPKASETDENDLDGEDDETPSNNLKKLPVDSEDEEPEEEAPKAAPKVAAAVAATKKSSQDVLEKYRKKA